MNIKYLMPTVLGLILSGGLLAAIGNTKPSTAAQLTCGRDTPGLMCNIDASPMQRTEPATATDSDRFAPVLVTNEQLAQGADLLLVLMYFGLPSALVFAVLIHDKRAAHYDRVVSQLERMWDNSHP